MEDKCSQCSNKPFIRKLNSDELLCLDHAASEGCIVAAQMRSEQRVIEVVQPVSVESEEVN